MLTPVILRERQRPKDLVCSLILSGNSHPAWNMALDEALLRSAQQRAETEFVLRFYGWDRPSASLGYFLRYAEALAACSAEPARYFVRRPTGGGLVRHDNDITYSLIFPEDMLPAEYRGDAGSYAFIHDLLRHALQGVTGARDLQSLPESLASQGRITDCFAQPSGNDLMAQGRKIAGAAQRRSKGWILHQGTIQLDSVILSGEDAKDLPQRFFACLTQAQNDNGLSIILSEPSVILSDAKALAQELFQARYDTDAWNKKF